MKEITLHELNQPVKFEDNSFVFIDELLLCVNADDDNLIIVSLYDDTFESCDINFLDKRMDTECTKITYQSGQVASLNIALPDKDLRFQLPKAKILAVSAKETIFVELPLWINLWVDNVLVLDKPCFRPEQIWIGSSMVSGTRGYGMSSDTSSHCKSTATVQCQIENTGAHTLTLSHIVIPCEALSLYSQQDRFVTSDVEICFHSNNENTSVSINDANHHKLTVVSKARNKVSHTVMNTKKKL